MYGLRRTLVTSLLSIGAVFALFAAFTHWFPLISGLTLHKEWSEVQFYVIFMAVNLTFFPQHFLGLAGIPRRYSDYPDALTKWNTISTAGSILSIVRLIIFIIILWEAFSAQRNVIARPHIPSSLEWQNILPLSFHNSNETGALIS